MNTVKLNDKYGFSAFPNLCEQVRDKEVGIKTNGHMTLDLTDLTFIDPFGMTTVIGICRHVKNTYGVLSTIHLPTGEAGSYMERAGFSTIEMLDPFIKVTRKKAFRDYFKKNKNMGVLRFFQAEMDILSINSEVEGWMATNGFSAEETNNISTFISEMVQNVVQHSNTPQQGVICIQSYTSKSTGQSILAWAIGDSGRGIRQSLIDSGMDRMENMSDSRVIREVVEKGLSRFPDDITRGNGLSRLFKAAQTRRATLFIHSHCGTFGWNSKDKRIEQDIPLLTGTNISFYISRD